MVDSNVFQVNLGYFSEKSNAVVEPAFPEINKKMSVLKPGMQNQLFVLCIFVFYFVTLRSQRRYRPELSVVHKTSSSSSSGSDSSSSSSSRVVVVA